MGKRLYFTVTNDLSYDQRMQRICNSLAIAGYSVTLVGRKLKGSLPLQSKSFRQKRLRCFYNKGPWFYREYNIRLFLFLFFKRIDAICAIDLDTILPCLYISRIKKIPRVYDAHELFTELKEVVTRPEIHKTWLGIEKKAVPLFKYGYTVSDGIAEEFKKRYGVDYATIRNTPVLKDLILPPGGVGAERYIIYQGAVNEARAFEYLIPAMKDVNALLVICGDGNFMQELKQLIAKEKVESKVRLEGMVTPERLWDISCRAWAGVAVAEKTGLNQWLALPNKFFDYLHAGLPQVTMNYPEYQKINKQYEVALLLDDLNPLKIAEALNKLLQDDVLHSRLRKNCLLARQELNWQQEEKKLIGFYQSVLNK